jgi:hypothetical protein
MLPTTITTRPATILKGILHIACFAIAECWLNAVNLDTLADYHEFIQNQLMREISQHQAIAQVSFNIPQAQLG